MSRLQAANDLAVDGVAGPQTYTALDRLRGDESRKVSGETDTERRGSGSGEQGTSDERRASAERPEREHPARSGPSDRLPSDRLRRTRERRTGAATCHGSG